MTGREVTLSTTADGSAATGEDAIDGPANATMPEPIGVAVVPRSGVPGSAGAAGVVVVRVAQGRSLGMDGPVAPAAGVAASAAVKLTAVKGVAIGGPLAVQLVRVSSIAAVASAFSARTEAFQGD